MRKMNATHTLRQAPGLRKGALLLAGVSGLACLASANSAQAAELPLQTEFQGLAAIAAGASDKPASLPIVEGQRVNKMERVSFAAPLLEKLDVTPKPVSPVLSLGLVDFEDTVQRGTPARFLGFSNYPGFVEHAELRLYEAGADLSGPPHAIIPANADGVMEWVPSTYAADRMQAVYRVYDAVGNFDETAPQQLEVLAAGMVMERALPSRPEFGVVDAAASRTIPVDEGQGVAISGSVSGDIGSVRVEGQPVVPSDAHGTFSSTQIVPADCVDITLVAVSPCGTEHQLAAERNPRLAAAQQAAGDPDDGLSISVRPAGTASAEQDQAVPEVDHAIDVRVDSGRIEPVLATGLADSVRIVVRGEEATFVSYNNYPALIERGEIRLFEAGANIASVPHAVVPVDANGIARWAPQSIALQDMFYVYRVYNEAGEFDETVAQELTVLDERPGSDAPPSRPLFGTRDEAALRTIPQRRTATVTVTGSADPGADIVRVGGQLVPVDETGRFVSEQIMPRDTDQILITIGQGEDVQFAALRDVRSTAADDWFIVGQGEVTIGHSWSSGPAEEVSGSTLADGDYAIGRAAFYANGPLGGEWEVTASLDTGEALVQDLLSNLDRKDPRQLLRRLNSEQYYPTYGDDSTLVEDAPTQGRFYLRVENGLSQGVIGNFVAQATGTDLVQLDRGLFGALVDVNSAGTTSFGERDAQFLAFASDPGTVPAREEFRGTGGSLYFLQRQDISVGSERVRVEVRDRDTGIVLEAHDLHPRQDYDFDPFAGRLTLLRPLASTVSSGSTVREGSSAGNVPVLVVRYEYSPPVGSLDGYTVGGRGSVWLADTLRIGATAQRDTVNEADQTVLGADALLRLTAGTFISAEIAQTEGAGFAQSNSIDGGLSFTDIANPGANVTAQAWRAEAAVNFAELAGRQGNLGTVSAFYEHLDQGFSAAGRLSPTETERWGVAADIPLGSTGNVSASFDEFSAESRGSSRTGQLDLSNRFAISGGQLTTSLGVRHDDLTPGNLYNSVQDGSRTDGAVELEFQPGNSGWSVHAFGQATLERDDSRSRNNRAGGGVTAELSDRLSLRGEVSGGDGGLGADVQLNHRLGEGSEAYVGYTVLADRTDSGLEPQNLFTGNPGGALVVGARHRFSDSLSVFGENRVSVGGEAPTLARSFGLQFDPSESVSITGTFENGHIDDPATGIFRRTAGSLAFGYTAEDFRAGAAIELRDEDGLQNDQTVWLFRSNLSYSVNPDWRFLSQFNLARADNEGTSIRAAEFTEAIAGFAWRPVNNDHVNGVIRLQYFEDLGPVGQITGSGEVESPKQVSAIFSADFNFDLSDTLTLGARYGYREGRVSLGRNSDDFVSSDAHLGVLRLDYNVLREWDLLVEGRALWVNGDDSLRLGALGAIYRHLGDEVKIGIGYSLSDFSADLTDQSYTSHGPFLNILGRF